MKKTNNIDLEILTTRLKERRIQMGYSLYNIVEALRTIRVRDIGYRSTTVGRNR